VLDVTDQKKTAGIDARTRPNPAAGDGPPAPEQEWDDRALPLGSRVGEFEITGLIGKGGFGIVYLAWDHSLERAVALKEYMPTSFAARRNRTEVSPLSERHRETFQVGLNSFVNEAKLLARFHSPSLVEVYRFWESNGTAYMAMPYYRGLTLGETIRAMPGPPGEAWLKNLLTPLTDALLVLHAVQCYHRDVAPDNILILSDSGAPLLLDFGAARRVIAGQAHALTVILKGGYAPIEQYGEFPGMQQGPWTDVYALASVVYWAITGETPPPATTRMIRDNYLPLAERAPPLYSRGFVTAIDRALAVLPEKRTASIDALRQELGLVPVAEPKPPPTMQWADDEATVVVPRTGERAVPELAETVEMPVAQPPGDPFAAPTERVPASPPRRPVPVAAGIGAAVILAAAGLGIWIIKGEKNVPAPAATVESGTAVAPLPPAAMRAPEAPVAPPVPVPQSAAAALELILARKAGDLTVGIDPGRSRLQSGGTTSSLAYSVSYPGHVYLIGLHAANDQALQLISPRAGAAPERARMNGEIVLPAGALAPGMWKFAVIVARQPVDLEGHGWVVEDKGWKRHFAGSLAPDRSALLPWDIPACAPADQECVSAYGAAAFPVDVKAAPAAPARSRRAPEPASPARPAERPQPVSTKKANDPECEKILLRMSLGEADQELIDRMKTLKCN
jgi:hypothetical protein